MISNTRRHFGSTKKLLKPGLIRHDTKFLSVTTMVFRDGLDLVAGNLWCLKYQLKMFVFVILLLVIPISLICWVFSIVLFSAHNQEGKKQHCKLGKTSVDIM